MRVNIGPLKGEKGASLRVEEDLPCPELAVAGEAVECTGPVAAHLTVTNTGSGYLVRGRLEAVVRLRCGRCLEPFEVRIEAPVEEQFVHPGGGAGGHLPSGAGRTAGHRDLREPRSQPQRAVEEQDEAERRLLEGDTIVLDEVVQESLQLALPMNPVCREECAGLCPVCGANRNLQPCSCEVVEKDPRWQSLASLFKDPQ